VAGSAGYGNYRHQSDVCHAYQLLVKSGMKPEQIITLAVDDIANSPSNPFPGKIFNKPTPAGTPGVDVYDGCKIDYSGDDVTPEMFTKVLTGDKSAGGKVLESNSESRVFVNFVDHGGVGIIGFPKTTMHATELIGALTTMHSQSMYKELVFYLEACESGSMFADLPSDIKIYATTASNEKESSWGTYCSPDDMVDGTSIRSCLGDLYSVSWMEDSDVQLIAGETLADQFTTVVKLTNKSHVMEYGATELKTQRISNFQGATDMMLGRAAPVEADTKPRNYASLPSPNAELASAYSRFMDLDSEEAGRELIQGIQERLDGNRRFHKISMAVTGQLANPKAPQEVDVECHYAVYKHYLDACGSFTSGSMKHSGTLANLCAHTGGDTAPIKAAISNACPK
jgi:legumain